VTGADPSVPEHVQPLIDGIPDDQSAGERKQAINLVCKYASAFSHDAYDMSRTKALQHSINTGDSQPVHEALHQHLQAHLNFIDSEVECS
jgi:hypothetical protein